MTEANKRQVGGGHYKKMPLEHWDLASIFEWDFFQYTITRYVMRWRDKNGLQDLEKVIHVAQKYFEIETLKKEKPLTWRQHIMLEACKKLDHAREPDAGDWPPVDEVPKGPEYGVRLEDEDCPAMDACVGWYFHKDTGQFRCKLKQNHIGEHAWEHVPAHSDAEKARRALQGFHDQRDHALSKRQALDPGEAPPGVSMRRNGAETMMPLADMDADALRDGIVRRKTDIDWNAARRRVEDIVPKECAVCHRTDGNHAIGCAANH